MLLVRIETSYMTMRLTGEGMSVIESVMNMASLKSSSNHVGLRRLVFKILQKHSPLRM